MRERGRRVLVATSTVGMVIGNFAAISLPLFGRTTGEVSARYQVLVTPAGYVFSIWGLIYLAMLAYSAAQFAGPLRDDDLPERLAIPIIVSNVANVLWLVLWHALLISLTVPVMLGLLGALASAYVIARTGRPRQVSSVERWAVRAPLGLYLGWVSVATIANIASALEAAGWNGFGLPDVTWAVIVLLVGALIALLVLAIHGDVVFAGVFVWAYVGIAVEAPAGLVPLAAGLLALALGVSAAALAIRSRALRAAH